MRKIKFGVLHTTAGPLRQTVAEIQAYWRRPKNKGGLGWKNNGYHHIITPDGKDHYITPIEQVSNGVAGFNANAIHIATTGGIDAAGRPVDNRTAAQKETQLQLIKRYTDRFPNIIWLGHRDFSTDQNGNGIIEAWEWIKNCPCYDAREWIAAAYSESVIIPAGIVYKLNYPLIKNEKVSEIQKALNRFGASLKTDGVFGAETDKAVKVFQAAYGLTPDGIVGPKTAQKLNVKI